jgi:hypothetical protein
MCHVARRPQVVHETRSHQPASPGTRASDIDREAVIDQLRTHTADGRLTLEEFEQRVEHVWTASTLGDLATVLHDLPPVERPPIRHARSVRLPTPLLVAAIVVLASVLLGHFAWWLIPVAFWVLRGCGGRATVGADAEADRERLIAV